VLNIFSDSKREAPATAEAFFIGLFTVKSFLFRHIKKEPAIDIAGLCLPLKPQKEKG